MFHTPPSPPYTHTHAHVHGPPTHTRTRHATRLPWVLGSIFSGPLRDPSPPPILTPPRPGPPRRRRTPHRRGDRFVYCRRGGERRAISLVCARPCACVSVRVRRTSGARRGVRVHTPAQSTAPLQCSVGLRSVFTRVVLRIYITRAPHLRRDRSRAKLFFGVYNNSCFILFLCFDLFSEKKNIYLYIYIKYLKRASPTKHTTDGHVCPTRV